MTDSQLLEAARRGEKAAFGRLVERYQALVCAVSYGATGDRALSEDVAQETFLAAWRQLGDLREPGKLRPWLCGIARNLGRKARRRLGRERPAASEADLAAGEASPFEATAHAESERIVWEALRRIPESYREALILYYREGQSAREVARALGISENAALQRLSRGRKELRAGVDAMVQRTLAASRPRPGFAGFVVAALPGSQALPHVSTPTPRENGGQSMFTKIALVLGAAALTGGTAYVVHQTRTSAPSEERASAAAREPEAATAPEASADVDVAPRVSPRTMDRPELPAAPETMQVAPEPDSEPRVDADTIDRLALYDGPSRGPDDAPVTVVLFTDFMCQFCGKVLGTVDELWDDYPGKLRLVIKQFPVHEEARLAAQAAFAARDQDKFWELHDLMLAHQDDLTEPALVRYAERAGLDVDRFRRDLDRSSFAGALESDIAAGKEVGVRGTPAFLLNGRLIVGARPIDQFRQMIDDELQKIARR